MKMDYWRRTAAKDFATSLNSMDPAAYGRAPRQPRLAGAPRAFSAACAQAVRPRRGAAGASGRNAVGPDFRLERTARHALGRKPEEPRRPQERGQRWRFPTAYG